jgi:hypothetical protein
MRDYDNEIHFIVDIFTNNRKDKDDIYDNDSSKKISKIITTQPFIEKNQTKNRNKEQ